MIRVANAPVSYGAFELTVGVLPNVPGPDEVLAAIAAAGYEGTELGPLGYLATGDELRERLDRHGLALAGAFVRVQVDDLDATLDVLAPFDARPVLADAGPRDGRSPWDDIQRAADRARERGLVPTFHHHMDTRVQTVAEIEELLERTDLNLLLDTGHLAVAGGDPVQALNEWRDRIDYIHLKDRRGGEFCELGTGDVDLDGFVAALGGYAGWIVVEQDWVPQPDEALAPQAEAQVRNRRWLREHAAV